MILSDASPAVICSTLDPVSPPNERAVVAPGSLVDRSPLAGSYVVSARDLLGGAWWIPAGAVWADIDVDGLTETPRSVGLGSGDSRDVAVLTGLSDRLGWEAEMARRHGVRLPVCRRLSAGRRDGTVVYDGRLGHDVPTVVVVSGDRVFCGAGATVDAAYERALYSERGQLGGHRELEHLGAMLAEAGLEVAAVDMATPTISDRGVHRVSVQLMLPTHDQGRSWDGDPLN